MWLWHLRKPFFRCDELRMMKVFYFFSLLNAIGYTPVITKTMIA